MNSILRPRIRKILLTRLSLSPDLCRYRPTELIPTTKVLSEQVAKADVALVTLGRTSGEFVDRNVSDFELSEEELQLLKSVSQAFHAAGKKVVVVLNIGGVIETASWKKLPDAILLAWQAGQEGGNSVTDVLSGKVSPSGKLTMTFPNKLMDVASSTNFPMDARANTDVRNKEDKSSSVKNVDYTDYEEDIFVGYRYFDSFESKCLILSAMVFRIQHSSMSIRLSKLIMVYILFLLM